MKSCKRCNSADAVSSSKVLKAKTKTSKEERVDLDQYCPKCFAEVFNWIKRGSFAVN